MTGPLHGVTVAMLGGDRRQLFLMEALLNLGARVKAVGFPQKMLPEKAYPAGSLSEALAQASALVLPMPGIDQEGNIRGVITKERLQVTPQLLSKLTPGTPLLVGVANPLLKEWAAASSLRLIEIAEDDETAILNSIPTAEGALDIAMQQSQVTIHGSNALVLGFGRVGVSMARVLNALGADTIVCARKAAARARAEEMRCFGIDWPNMKDVLPDLDFIFNTVPHPVLAGQQLMLLQKSTVIVDLASAPGGVDFQAAQALGIKAILAPGLPGKVAAKTAGMILARTVPRMIMDHLA